MGADDLDISLFKSLSLGKERKLRLEVSSYNVANRAQFGMPSVPSINAVNTQSSAATSFGLITSTINSPRQFQFGSRFTF